MNIERLVFVDTCTGDKKAAFRKQSEKGTLFQQTKSQMIGLSSTEVLQGDQATWPKIVGATTNKRRNVTQTAFCVRLADGLICAISTSGKGTAFFGRRE